MSPTPITGKLDQALSVQSTALALRVQRQQVLAANIANADTPGYIARDMDFRKALLAATGGEAGGGGASMPGSPGGASALGDDELVYARTSQDGLDNTKVDMDRERASWAENAVKYEATLRFINSQARALLDAMKPANQG